MLERFPMNRIFRIRMSLLLLLVLLGLLRSLLGMGLVDIFRSSHQLGYMLCMIRLILFELSIL